MEKGLLTILVLILVVFVSGCGGMDTGGPPTIDYHTGTQGIVINFMQSSPPTDIFDGDTVPFILEVRNQGAEATSPSFWLSGHDRNIIPVSWDGESTGNIEARDENNPIGGYAVLEARPVITLPDNVDTYSTNMKLTACYPYTTYASAQVCVDPDPTQNQDDACAARDISLGGGQGGPVAITHIGVDSSTERVRFALRIENVGDGTIIEAGAVGECTNLMASQIDVVSVSPQDLSGQSLDCRPNPLRLVNGKGIVYCEASVQNFPSSAFTTLLSVTLDYGYKTSISKTVNVMRI